VNSITNKLKHKRISRTLKMGCGNSKDEKDSNKIKFDMKPTGVTGADDFFNSASEVLEKAEDIRKRISGCHE
jgi:hypothetical protein